MQFGGSPRVFKFGYVLLLTVLGTVMSAAQFSQFGQALGNTAGQQQSSCSPSDPACQSYSDQGRNASQINQQQPTNPQGIVLPGQQEDQNNTTNMQTGNRTQQQQGVNAETRLPLDPPTEFQQMIANSIGKTLPIYFSLLFRHSPSTFAP